MIKKKSIYRRVSKLYKSQIDQFNSNTLDVIIKFYYSNFCSSLPFSRSLIRKPNWSWIESFELSVSYIFFRSLTFSISFWKSKVSLILGASYSNWIELGSIIDWHGTSTGTISSKYEPPWLALWALYCLIEPPIL